MDFEHFMRQVYVTLVTKGLGVVFTLLKTKLTFLRLKEQKKNNNISII